MAKIKKGNCRYFHIQVLAEEDEKESLIDNIIYSAIESSETYPRQFICFPNDWDRNTNTWVTSKIPELDGESYLVPFILNEGPKSYKRLREPEG